MDVKQKNVFRIKDGDNIVDITSSLLDKHLSKRDSKTLYNLLLKQESRKVISEQEQSKIMILLSRLEINMLLNENETDIQKKRIKNLLSANKAMENKLNVISMSKKLLSILAVLFAIFMIVLATGEFTKPSIFNIFLISSLLINVFISIFMIYCKEEIWNWKIINPIIKIIWWSVILICMVFAANSIIRLLSLVNM